MIQEYRIKNWSDFDSVVFKDSWNSEIKRHRTDFVFRGLSHSIYPLKPSLNRICSNKLDLEKALLRNFKKYSSLEIKDSSNFWEIVSLAQHHGLPTRLLDWSFSPYVAAHFATESFSHYNVDGAIWCIDFVKCREFLPDSLKGILKDNMANTFSIDMLKDVIKDFESLEKLENNSEGFPLFFEPPSLDGRIINQYALFSVMSNSQQIISDWLENHNELGFKIIIPASAKLEIRDKLDQININERSIYPGIDGLCRWLCRHYTPTENIKTK